MQGGGFANPVRDLAGEGIGITGGGNGFAQMEAKTGDERGKKSGLGGALYDGEHAAGIDRAGETNGKVNEEAEGIPAGFRAGQEGF